MLRVRGNAAEVPGTYVPWLPFAAITPPGAQSIKAQNRLGGSAEARGPTPGSSSTPNGVRWLLLEAEFTIAETYYR